MPVLALDGKPCQTLPCSGPVRYSEDRRKDVQAPLSWPRPSQELGLAGGWVGGHCIPSSAGWFTMYSRRWLQPGRGSRSRYLTRFSTEYTEM